MRAKKRFYLWLEAPPNGRPESVGVKRGGMVYYHPLAKTTRTGLVRLSDSYEELEKQMNLLYPPRNLQPHWGLMSDEQIKKFRAFVSAAASNIVTTRRR